ncbi:MAG: hypothetical protein ACJAVV_003650 [Alphaproteobacteria bacterium]|jgi:hypothetical protein
MVHFVAKEGVAILTTYDFANKTHKFLLTSDNKKVKINWSKWANEEVLIVSASYEARQRSVLYYQYSYV